MGFHRQLQPTPLDRAAITAIVARAVEITSLTCSDPFGIDDPCPGSPDGHYHLWDHQTLVCPHCAKVLWSS